MATSGIDNGYDRIAPKDRAGMTIRDVTTYGGWSRSTTYNLLHVGLIKAIRVGSRRIVLRESVDSYMKSLLDEAA